MRREVISAKLVEVARTVATNGPSPNLDHGCQFCGCILSSDIRRARFGFFGTYPYVPTIEATQ